MGGDNKFGERPHGLREGDGESDGVLPWSIVRIRKERVERIVAGAGGLEAKVGELDFDQWRR